MPETSSRFRNAAIAILLAAPIANLIINSLSWLHYGIDLPFYDDIRPFLTRSATSLDPTVLFKPSNDTLYPVGMALDALAQRYLNGNAVAYQFISMICILGGLLWMQWRLLTAALEDRLHAAVAFSCTFLMLWPESYWGLQSLAYHHGLPIFFLISALTLMLTTRWSAWWGMPVVFVLGLLAGFAYISGAFAILAAAITLVGLSFFLWPRFPALRSGGVALLAAGVISVCAQVWVIVFYQHGRIHDPAAPWAWPTDPSFWMFLLGKIGRGLALPFERPALSLVVVLAVLALVVVLAVRLLQRLARERSDIPDGVIRTAVVFLALAAAIAAYLPLLAAGRAYLGAPADHSLMTMFIHGFPEHYHSFWVTVLVPWIAAAAMVMWRGAFRSQSPRRYHLAAFGAGVLVYAAVEAGAFDHSRYYREITNMRMRTDVVCIKTILETGVHECPLTYAPQVVGALTYARQIGSSFNRYFPLKPIPLGTEDPAPLFRLARDPDKIKYVNFSAQMPTAEGLALESPGDPILEITLPPGSLATCWEVEVSMAVKATQPDYAELFALKQGQTAFAAPSAALAPTRGGMFTTVVLRAYNLQGFNDSLRIDPVTGPQPITLKDLEVRCRQNVPGPND